MKRHYERAYWLKKDGKSIFGAASDLKKYDKRLGRISDFYLSNSPSAYGWVIKGVKEREYALYKGETLIDIGTRPYLIETYGFTANYFNQLRYMGKHNLQTGQRSIIMELTYHEKDFDTNWRY